MFTVSVKGEQMFDGFSWLLLSYLLYF